MDVDPLIRRRWRLGPGRFLGGRQTRTWRVERDGRAFALKHFGAAAPPDWPYQLRVAEALRAQGWPTPVPVEEPITTLEGAWVLLDWRPGEPRVPSGAEQRYRGRLLAELHQAAAATGITERRRGFPSPSEVVADPELERRLRVHERTAPQEGALLRAHRDAAAAWFAAHPGADLPRGVIHGDFAPWNLLFDGDRLSGVLDLDTAHHTVLTADFALSWRGYQDEVLRGYDEVRPLSPLEWASIRPVYWAWLFLGVRDHLAAGQDGGEVVDLSWPAGHLRKVSPLLDARLGPAQV